MRFSWRAHLPVKETVEIAPEGPIRREHAETITVGRYR